MEKVWGEERDSRVSTRATALQINPLCKGDDEAYGGARTRQSGRGTASSPVHKSDSPRCVENVYPRSEGKRCRPTFQSLVLPFYTVDQIVEKERIPRLTRGNIFFNFFECCRMYKGY